MPEPLSGIRVLEVTTALQGPSAGLYLADMGADVIKIEPPEGDSSRFARGVGNELPPGALGAQFIAANRGKRSVTLDIHHPLSREAILRLADQVDIFLSNYMEDALERMGVGYEDLHARNPQLVYAVVNGFGSRGPLAAKRMVDGAAQARGGIANVTGEADGPPMFPGAAIADTGGGMQLALAIMTGLVARARHGIGQKVSVSAYGAQLWLQMWEITHNSITGRALTRQGAHHPNIPGGYGMYGTADGRGIFLAYPRSPESWQAFCDFAGRPEVGVDERWNSVQKFMGMSGDAGGTAAQLRSVLREMFGSKTTAEWSEFLTGQPDIIWDPIATYDDVLSDPQAAANDYIVERDIPTIGRRKVVGNLVALSETAASAKETWPEWGQHTEEVLLELGYEWDAIEEMVSHAHDVVREKFIALGAEPPF